jgi:DNA repair protein RadC
MMTSYIQTQYYGAGEMAQWLRAPTTLPKVLSSNPSNHMMAHNHPQQDLTPSSRVSEDSYSVLSYNESLKKKKKNSILLKIHTSYGKRRHYR